MPDPIVYELDLSLYATTDKLVENLKQGDQDLRAFQIRLLERTGLVYDIPEGMKATVSYRKADGHVVTSQADIHDNLVYAVPPAQALRVRGDVIADLTLSDGTSTLSSQRFVFKVVQTSRDYSKIDSASEYVEIKEYIDHIVQASNDAKQASALVAKVKEQACACASNAVTSQQAAEQAKTGAETAKQASETAAERAESAQTESTRIQHHIESRVATAESVKQAVEGIRDGIVTEEEARKVSEQTRQQAEQARHEAEQQRTEAEASRQSAEGLRQTAETERSKHENARARTEQARSEAEAGRVNAESQRAQAEETRNTKEQERQTSEEARNVAESERATVETERAQAEEERKQAETTRKQEEGKRAQAEETRARKEETRGQREIDRAQAEARRYEAETARKHAEETRAQNESTRGRAEVTRAQAEATREREEAQRGQNEEARKTAEQQRETAHRIREQALTDYENAERMRVQAEQRRAQAEEERGTSEQARTRKEAEREEAETARNLAEANREKAETERGKQSTQNHERAQGDHARFEALLQTLSRMEGGQIAGDVATIKSTMATKEEVRRQLSEIIDEAPEDLDTLKELAEAFKSQGGEVKAILNKVTQLTAKHGQDMTATEARLSTLETKAEASATASEVAEQMARKVSASDFETYKTETASALATKAGASELASLRAQVGEDLQARIRNKVDKEEGKGLSSNDFTDEQAGKLASFDRVTDYILPHGETYPVTENGATAKSLPNSGAVAKFVQDEFNKFKGGGNADALGDLTKEQAGKLSGLVVELETNAGGWPQSSADLSAFIKGLNGLQETGNGAKAAELIKTLARNWASGAPITLDNPILVNLIRNFQETADKIKTSEDTARRDYTGVAWNMLVAMACANASYYPPPEYLNEFGGYYRDDKTIEQRWGEFATCVFAERSINFKEVGDFFEAMTSTTRDEYESKRRIRTLAYLLDIANFAAREMGYIDSGNDYNYNNMGLSAWNPSVQEFGRMLGNLMRDINAMKFITDLALRSQEFGSVDDLVRLLRRLKEQNGGHNGPY